MSRLPVRPAVVVALLVAGSAVGQGLLRAQPPVAAAHVVPVVGASAVCPDLRQQLGAVQTGVTAGLAGAGPGTTVSVTTGGTAAALPVSPSAPVVADLGAGAADGTLTVQASGPGAAGLVSQQSALVTAGPVRGLAALACSPPVTDFWLLGGGTVAGETSTLVLVNPDPQIAVVDVGVLAAEGPADPRPGQGLRVPASGRLVVAVDTLAPDRSALALHVHAERGRVVGALRQERSDGLVPRGVEYAAPAPAPAATVVVPGLPAGPGYRAVQVANPGDADLNAQVQVTTADGQFVPEGLGAVPVRAGSTALVDLTGVLAGTPAAVRVASDAGPLLAAGVVETVGAGDVRDLARPGPAPALAGPALLPDVQRGTADSTLLLSALSGDAVVELAVVPVVGGPAVPAAVRRVDVPGGRTVAVPVGGLLPAGTTGRVAVEVRPDRRGSPVHAGVVVTAQRPDGPLVTALALLASPSTVPAPPVVRDPAVGAGAG